MQGGNQKASGFSFWDLSSSLVDSVAKNANSFVSTIVETDWKKELTDIQEGLQKDTRALEQRVEHQFKSPDQAQEHHPTAVAADGAGPSTSARAPPAQAHGQADPLAAFTAFGQSLMHGTADIFEQVKSAVDSEFQSVAALNIKDGKRKPGAARQPRAADGKAKFSRLDMEVLAMQRDSDTYCDEPADSAALATFMCSFDLAAHRSDVEATLRGNAFMAQLHERLVPLVVEEHVFWARYFFRLQQLMAAHEQRARLVQRASRHAECADAWDNDDEEAGVAANTGAPGGHAAAAVEGAATAGALLPDSPDTGASRSHGVAATDELGAAWPGQQAAHEHAEAPKAHAGSNDHVDNDSVAKEVEEPGTAPPAEPDVHAVQPLVQQTGDTEDEALPTGNDGAAALTSPHDASAVKAQAGDDTFAARDLEALPPAEPPVVAVLPTASEVVLDGEQPPLAGGATEQTAQAPELGVAPEALPSAAVAAAASGAAVPSGNAAVTRTSSVCAASGPGPPAAAAQPSASSSPPCLASEDATSAAAAGGPPAGFTAQPAALKHTPTASAKEASATSPSAPAHLGGGQEGSDDEAAAMRVEDAEARSPSPHATSPGTTPGSQRPSDGSAAGAGNGTASDWSVVSARLLPGGGPAGAPAEAPGAANAGGEAAPPAAQEAAPGAEAGADMDLEVEEEEVDFDELGAGLGLEEGAEEDDGDEEIDENWGEWE